MSIYGVKGLGTFWSCSTPLLNNLVVKDGNVLEKQFLLLSQCFQTYKKYSYVDFSLVQKCGIFQPFPKQALVFTCLQYKFAENTVRKGEIALNEQFLLFQQCFLSVRRSFRHFHQIFICKLL